MRPAMPQIQIQKRSGVSEALTAAGSYVQDCKRSRFGVNVHNMKSETIGVRMTLEQRVAVEALAARGRDGKRVTPSALIAEMVNACLERVTEPLTVAELAAAKRRLQRPKTVQKTDRGGFEHPVADDGLMANATNTKPTRKLSRTKSERKPAVRPKGSKVAA